MSLFAHARTILRASALMCLTVAAPAAARSWIVDQTNIVSAMNSAGPGDTITLVPGGYGVVSLPRKTWQTPITIDARAATVSGVVFFKASGVNWVGGSIIGSVYAVSIQFSSHINVSNADISGAIRGIVINGSSDLKIQRNKLHDLRSDGIDVIGQRVLIEGNTILSMSPIPGDHPDGIQLWSANNEQTSDITIRGNTITGSMQGIFGRAPALGMSNLVVTGNKVYVDYANGIVLGDTTDSIVTGNSVKSTTLGQFDKANMRVEGANNMACGNVVPDVPKAIANQPCTS
jgi:nitrous oxidase accessory protein NosD